MNYSIKRRMIDQVGLWFAPVTLGGATLAVWAAFARGDLRLLGSVLIILYLWPPLLSRVTRRLWPQSTPGPQPAESREFLLWQFGHRIERLYWYFPAFEQALRCVPGVYSAWLRLWGAEVGTSVFWGNTRILDRGLLRVGDRVVFGDSVSVMSHVVVRRTGGGLWLRTMDVVVGNDVLVGAHSVLGPGTNLADETSLAFGSQEWASLRTLLGSER